MQRWILFAVAVCALLGAEISSAAAQGRGGQDRYCLQGRLWGYPGNCQFSSYRQCMVTASGTDAYCGTNPRYSYGYQRPRYLR
jgi:hypothetical protein